MKELFDKLYNKSEESFYKIFSNSITVIKDYMNKKAYSIEEVIGASLLVAIAVLALEPIQIFGFSLKNICSILLVLILGWKHRNISRWRSRNYNRCCICNFGIIFYTR